MAVSKQNQVLTSRKICFHTNKNNHYLVGMNAFANRLNNLRDKLPLEWLNKSYNINKIKFHPRKVFYDNFIFQKRCINIFICSLKLQWNSNIIVIKKSESNCFKMNYKWPIKSAFFLLFEKGPVREKHDIFIHLLSYALAHFLIFSKPKNY
jgi:hypothetical protein